MPGPARILCRRRFPACLVAARRRFVMADSEAKDIILLTPS